MLSQNRAILLTILLILAVIRFALLPLNSRIQDANSTIARKTAEYCELKNIIGRNNAALENLNAYRGKYRQFPATISFLGYIETQLDKRGIRKKINKLTQKESAVSEKFVVQTAGLQLSDLTLADLTGILDLFNHTGYMIKPANIEIKKDAYNNFQLSIELSAFSENSKNE